MKKVLLSFIIVLAGLLDAQAQIWVGGSVDMRLDKEAKSFSISPDVGYSFPNTPLAIACALEYGGTYQTGNACTHSLIISPYLHYDICDIGEYFSLYVDLVSDIDVLEFSSFDVGLNPGIAFDLTEHWSAEFGIGFLGFQSTKGDTIEQSFVADFAPVASSFSVYYEF